MSDIDWPAGVDRTPPSEREPYPHGFGVTRTQAIDSIIDQLDKMDARDVQIDSGADHQIRNPNYPYSDADADDPGIVVRYRLDGTPHITAMDKWDNLRDNARAVALTLKAKRSLTRYGVESVESEFKTQRLPPADEDDDVIVAGSGNGMSEDPHEVLGVTEDADEAVIRGAYRELIKKYHADTDGTSDAVELQKVRQAKEALLE